MPCLLSPCPLPVSRARLKSGWAGAEPRLCLCCEKTGTPVNGLVLRGWQGHGRILAQGDGLIQRPSGLLSAVAITCPLPCFGESAECCARLRGTCCGQREPPPLVGDAQLHGDKQAPEMPGNKQSTETDEKGPAGLAGAAPSWHVLAVPTLPAAELPSPAPGLGCTLNIFHFPWLVLSRIF